MRERYSYDLSGGGRAVILRLFGLQCYLALVRIRGNYPDKGLQARNSGRNERIVVLSGNLSLFVNGVQYHLGRGDSLRIADSSYYNAEGSALILVIVDDRHSGAVTQLEPRAGSLVA